VTSKAGLATASPAGNWRRAAGALVEAMHQAEFVAVALLDGNVGAFRAGEIEVERGAAT
jgi:hypothetical protein